MYMKTITVKELKERLEHNNNGRSYAFVDVREDFEREEAHIEGTLHIPLSEIEEHVQELAGYDDVYIHCRSGGRSASACDSLESIGLTNVVNVQGGISEWYRLGYPIK